VVCAGTGPVSIELETIQLHGYSIKLFTEKKLFNNAPRSDTTEMATMTPILDSTSTVAEISFIIAIVFRESYFDFNKAKWMAVA
jgi:hypothetical protein